VGLGPDHQARWRREVTRAAEREVEEARVVPQAGEEEEHGVDQRWLFAAGRLSGPRPASAFAFGAIIFVASWVHILKVGPPSIQKERGRMTSSLQAAPPASCSSRCGSGLCFASVASVMKELTPFSMTKLQQNDTQKN
jgi:hypothetical protein